MRNTADLTRRDVLRAGAAALAPALLGVRPRPVAAGQGPNNIGPFAAGVLSSSIRSRFVDNGNGITMHVLEAGFEARNRPLVVSCFTDFPSGRTAGARCCQLLRRPAITRSLQIFEATAVRPAPT